MTTRDRVIELINEQGIDIERGIEEVNECLIIDITIIYLQAQRDLLAEQLELMKKCTQ